MANMKHFNGDTELTRIQVINGKRVGEPIDSTPTWSATESRWIRDLRPVERTIEFKRNPSRHECDSRCLNATGRIMRCECSCGGKNHGRGAFVCEAAA